MTNFIQIFQHEQNNIAGLSHNLGSFSGTFIPSLIDERRRDLSTPKPHFYGPLFILSFTSSIFLRVMRTRTLRHEYHCRSSSIKVRERDGSHLNRRLRLHRMLAIRAAKKYCAGSRGDINEHLGFSLFSS